MAAAAIMNFENWLPFHYMWTEPHQIKWECLESDIERNCCIKNAYLQKFMMAAAAILTFDKYAFLMHLLRSMSDSKHSH